jgi:alpha-mannosidase
VLLSVEQRLERLRVRLEELSYWRARAWVDLDGWTFDGAPLRLGDLWPRRDGVVSLAHPEIEVTHSWPLDAVDLELDLGGEGLVRIRYSDGTSDAAGIDPWHTRWRLRGRRFSVEAEAEARLPLGRPNPAARLRVARVVHFEPAVEGFERRVRLICEAVAALGSSEVQTPLLECAEEAVAALDWPSGTPAYLARTAGSDAMASLWSPPAVDHAPDPLAPEEIATLEAASARLEERLTYLRSRYPQQGRLALTGHAHLDVAWLWPLEETRRKAVRSFHTAAGLMSRYDEFRFNQSSAQIYEFVESDDPALFEEVRKRVAEGRWEPVGGMWVEPDANMPCGESLVRQLLYGQRYFRSRFGFTHDVCWLPDCFGFSPALPQLLRGAGIESFLTIKVNWSETNKLPYDLFWWEGIDGSRVLAHTFDNPANGYNGDPRPHAVLSTWRNFRGKHRHPESLMSIGLGDGGGGPTEDMLEAVRALEAFPALPALRFSLVRDYFTAARAAAERAGVPAWAGELYLEYHRGTLTTQGRIKWLHRRAERDLVAAEVVGSMEALAGGPEPAGLERLWRILLRNQFHDVLPGSGIREIYEAAESELAGVVEDAGGVIEARLGSLARRVAPPGEWEALVVVNPDLSARPLRVSLGEPTLGAQRVEDGYVLSDRSTVRALSVRAVVDVAAPDSLWASAEGLENAFVRVALAPDGTLQSVFDKQADRELLADRGNQIWAFVDKPRAFDAWEIDAGYTEAGEEIGAAGPPEVVESGPHRAAVRIRRSFRSSRLTQDVRLWSNSPRLEFRTVIDWHDRHWLLKARFPVSVRATHAVFETAFGIVERPTYRNTSWDAAQFEVCGHRFADLSEPGYGVALLNDGRYGHHALGSELGLTLLRSPAYPDPRADEGRQAFTYGLLGHRGRWLEGGVLAEAEDLNRPLLARPGRVAKGSEWTAARLEGIPLGLGALKPLEDGKGLVLRAYEPQGARGEARVVLPSGWEAESDLDLLESATGPATAWFAPFKVRSWLLRARR